MIVTQYQFDQLDGHYVLRDRALTSTYFLLLWMSLSLGNSAGRMESLESSALESTVRENSQYVLGANKHTESLLLWPIRFDAGNPHNAQKKGAELQEQAASKPSCINWNYISNPAF